MEELEAKISQADPEVRAYIQALREENRKLQTRFAKCAARLETVEGDLKAHQAKGTVVVVKDYNADE